MRQRSHINKIYIVNIFKIKKKAKSNIIKKEYYKYKETSKNYQRRNNNNTYNIFN